MNIFLRLVAAAVVLMLSEATVPVSGQTPATGQVMREKLTHAHAVLDAIMTSDYASLDRHCEELLRTTDAPAWSVLKTLEYRQYSDAFLHNARKLAEAAKQRDLDAAAERYAALTLSCYQCHRYVKNARMAR